MPEMIPFRGWRYAPSLNLAEVPAPPYDVLSDADVAAYAARDVCNIVHVDVPPQTPEGYRDAAATLGTWMADGTMVRDAAPTLTLYRLSFDDATGAPRAITGVFGGLPVVDYGKGPVLPHENVTPKASTDRLDLTRATNANLSPVWGLSLASGLAGLLQKTWDDAVAGGAEPAGMTEAGVTHEVLPVADTGVIESINSLLKTADVLIADGHHRYGVAQKYRDEMGAAIGSNDPAAYTLAFVNELVDDQLSVEAIHRVYDGVPLKDLMAALATCFDISHASPPTPATLAEMVREGRLVLIAKDGSAAWLTPKPGAFDGIRALDGAWLEHALADVAGLQVTYQHGLSEVLKAIHGHTAAILIRPTSIDEIRRTATEGLLMPPKSTFFTPKLRTGLLVRALDEM